MRNALDELPWERAKTVSSAGGTATYLAMDRPQIACSIRKIGEFRVHFIQNTPYIVASTKLASLGEPTRLTSFSIQGSRGRTVQNNTAGMVKYMHCRL